MPFCAVLPSPCRCGRALPPWMGWWASMSVRSSTASGVPSSSPTALLPHRDRSLWSEWGRRRRRGRGKRVWRGGRWEYVGIDVFFIASYLCSCFHSFFVAVPQLQKSCEGRPGYKANIFVCSCNCSSARYGDTYRYWRYAHRAIPLFDWTIIILHVADFKLNLGMAMSEEST